MILVLNLYLTLFKQPRVLIITVHWGGGGAARAIKNYLMNIRILTKTR